MQEIIPPTTAALHHQLQEKIKAFHPVASELPSIVVIHNLETLDVEYMSPKGLEILGLTLEEIKTLGKEYHHLYFNPEDLEDYAPKITTLLKENKQNEFVSYFQQVRSSPQHEWQWYLSTTKIFMTDDKGQPTHIITFAIPVDPKHHITNKVNRLLEENIFLRKNKTVFASLTKREKEILKLMALGFNSNEIAEKLFISIKTAKTHRRNIRSKLQAQTNYDITRFAQAFDLI